MRKKTALALIILLSLCDVALAVYAASPIWSAPSGPVTGNTVYSGAIGAVSWNGTSPFNGGDVLVLRSTLTPTPANPQSVAFYYSLSPIVMSNGVPSNPSALVLIASPLSVVSVASVNWVVPASGNGGAGGSTQYYFIAEISSPSA